jgi:hypothetical protein
MTPEEQQAMAAMAGHLADLVTLVDPLREATVGYRNSLIDKGMAKDSADRCAADFHHWLIAQIMPKGAYGVGGKA